MLEWIIQIYSFALVDLEVYDIVEGKAVRSIVENCRTGSFMTNPGTLHHLGRDMDRYGSVGYLDASAYKHLS